MNDIENLEREVDALEQKTGIDFDRKMDAIEAKRVGLQRRKAGHCPTTGDYGDAPADGWRLAMMTQLFQWSGGGEVAFDVIGQRRDALLLPALSSISNRSEMHSLARDWRRISAVVFRIGRALGRAHTPARLSPH